MRDVIFSSVLVILTLAVDYTCENVLDHKKELIGKF